MAGSCRPSVVVEERRSARVGTVSGLALLAGGTTIAAVANASSSPFAAGLLGLLTVGLGHSLTVEIRRQAHRGAAGGWGLADTINAVLLGGWAEVALSATIMMHGSTEVWVVGLALSLAYAAACGYFVTQRRRAIAAQSRSAATASPAGSPAGSPAPVEPDSVPAGRAPTSSDVARLG